MSSSGAPWRPLGQNLPWERRPSSILRRILGAPSFRAQLVWRYVYQLLEGVNFDRWLDIGCGGGDLLVESALRNPDASFVGIDRDTTAIANARDLSSRARVLNTSWKVGSAEDFESRDFDVVSSIGLLECASNPQQAIALWASFVRNGGFLVFAAPHAVPNDSRRGYHGRFGIESVRAWMTEAFARNPVVIRGARSWAFSAYRLSQRLQHDGFLAASFHLLSAPLVLMDSRLPGNGDLLFCAGEINRE